MFFRGAGRADDTWRSRDGKTSISTVCADTCFKNSHVFETTSMIVTKRIPCAVNYANDIHFISGKRQKWSNTIRVIKCQHHTLHRMRRVSVSAGKFIVAVVATLLRVRRGFYRETCLNFLILGHVFLNFDLSFLFYCFCKKVYFFKNSARPRRMKTDEIVWGCGCSKPTKTAGCFFWWRPKPELNRRTRLCRPLHHHSAIGPVCWTVSPNFWTVLALRSQ